MEFENPGILFSAENWNLELWAVKISKRRRIVLCLSVVTSELWIGNSEITSSTRRFVNLQLFGSGSGFGYYGPKTQNIHQRLGPIRVFFFFWAWPTSNPNHYWFEMDTTFFLYIYFDRRWLLLNLHIAYFPFCFCLFVFFFFLNLFLSYRIDTLPTWCLKSST